MGSKLHLINTGFACNNTCLFCAQGALRSSQPAPAGDDILKTLQSAITKKNPAAAIAFVGGEPTLYDELPQWISQAKTLGADRVIIQTNGRRLAYQDFTAKLAEAGLDGMDVSLHGSTAAMHDYHTRVDSSWIQTLAGLKNAKNLGIKFGITAVITRSNFRNLPEIAELAAALGAAAIHFQEALPLGTAAQFAARVVPAEELVSPYLAAAVERARQLGLGVFSNATSSSDFSRSFFAGLGRTQPAAATAAAAAPTLQSPPKAKPGLAEIHRREKKTGADLKELFPTLFERSPERAS
ncbi:MAG: radical SAM protein [Elusimicrobia bacterium]|nr:radical SAM protein [Elusimicrobiota bacterium]